MSDSLVQDVDPVKIEVFRDGLPPPTTALLFKFVVFFTGRHRSVCSRVVTDSKGRGDCSHEDGDASITQDGKRITLNVSSNPGSRHFTLPHRASPTPKKYYFVYDKL